MRADHGILHGPHAGGKPIQALERRRVIALDRDGLAGVPGVGAGAEDAQGPQDTVEESAMSVASSPATSASVGVRSMVRMSAPVSLSVTQEMVMRSTALS